MKKRLLALVLSVMTVATIFTGCGKDAGKDDGNDTASGTEAQKGLDITTESWAEGLMIINGGTIQIGKTSYEDFKNITGFTTVVAANEYGDYKCFYLSDGNSTLRIYTTPDESMVGYIYINEKYGDGVDGETYTFDTEKTSVVIPGGFTLGQSTIDEVHDYDLQFEDSTHMDVSEAPDMGIAEYSACKKVLKEDGTYDWLDYLPDYSFAVSAYLDTRILYHVAINAGDYEVSE